MSRKIRLSLGFLLLLMFSSLLANFFDQPVASAGSALLAPSLKNVFGTDALGRDLLFRLLEGTRVSMGIGLLTTFGAFICAIAVAFAAFRAPRWLDDFIMRSVEILMAMPNLVTISMTILFLNNAIIEKSSFDKMIIVSTALIFTSWFTLARQIRSLLEGEKTKPYVDAARVIGCSEVRVYLKHLLPNLATPLLILLGLQIPNQLLFESFLSFVGLGIQPPTASWGVLIQEGWRTLSVYPHLILIPSLILFLTVLSFNVLFEEIRKNLLPKV